MTMTYHSGLSILVFNVRTSMWVESVHRTCSASTTTCEDAMTGTLWLRVGKRECDFGEATRL